MKKLLSLLAAVTLTFTACEEPLADINDQIDAAEDKSMAVADVEVTITDDDYTSIGAAIADMNNYLSAEYPTLGVAYDLNNNVSSSTAKITFATTDLHMDFTVPASYYGAEGFFGESDINTIIAAANAEVNAGIDKGMRLNVTYNGMAAPVADEDYTLTASDYDSFGEDWGDVGKFDNFDIRAGKPEETIEARLEKIDIILRNNFPNAAEGVIYDVTYAYYDGSSGTLNMVVEFDGSAWVMAENTIVEVNMSLAYTTEWELPYEFSSDEYDAMERNYPNFDSMDQAMRMIPIYLGSKHPYAQEGDFYALSFYNYGARATAHLNYVFMNGAWTIYYPVLKFGHDGEMWKVDNTIKYTLTVADFELVGNGRYKNFDVRPGKDEETIEARLAKINTILLNNFPDLAVDGQKFEVSYAVWMPGNGIFTTKVIYSDADQAYILQ